MSRGGEGDPCLSLAPGLAASCKPEPGDPGESKAEGWAPVWERPSWPILGLGASARVSYWRLHAAEEQKGAPRMPRPPVRRLLGVSGGGRPGERKEAGETLTATGLLRRSPPFAPWAAAHRLAGRSRGWADWTSPPHPAPARLQTAKPSHPRAFGGGVVYTPPGGVPSDPSGLGAVWILGGSWVSGSV